MSELSKIFMLCESCQDAKELEKFLQTQIGKKLSVIIEKDGIGKSENFLDVKIAGEGIKLKSSDIVEVVILSAEKDCLVGIIKKRD